MGIRFTCPNGHKLHVKAFLAGKRGVCPQCGSKILIPSAEEPQALAAAHPPGDTFGPNQAEAAATRRSQPAEIGSQSIIIAVADMPVVAAPPVDAEPSSAITAQSSPPSIIGTPHATPSPPVLAADTMAPVSPAVRYVAYRERSRRNQVTIAVVLLVAVIVLAIVLILVLQRGSVQPSAGLSQPIGLRHHDGFSAAVMELDDKMNPPRDGVATT